MVTDTSTLTNIERIAGEIERQARETVRKNDVAALDVVRLLMEIVDLEDNHRVRPVAQINRRIKGMVQDATRADVPTGET